MAKKYTKRADGRYQARVYIGLDENKKKKFKYIYAATVKELEKLEREMRSKLDKGIDILSLTDSYKTWLDRLKIVKKADLTESEYETFKYRTEYFLPYIGDMALKDISQSNIQPVISDLFSKNPITGKPSSKRTLERYVAAVSQVFEYAIENRATDFNPCKYVKIPKGAVTGERRALTQEERRRIEEMPHRAQTAAMIMMYSGLRKGELTALLWTDVDLKNATISVTKSYDFKHGLIKLPKTDSGYRVVSIPQKLVAYLKAVKRTSIYVVTTANNKMMSTDTAWRALWQSYMTDLNLKYGKQIEKKTKFDPKGNIMTIDLFTPHCLRHTFCTMMYEAGVDVLTAKEQMGHSDVKTTLAIYTHLDKTYKKKNINKLDAYLNASNY